MTHVKCAMCSAFMSNLYILHHVDGVGDQVKRPNSWEFSFSINISCT